MAEAVSALTGDVGFGWYNPSGLVGLRGPQMSSHLARLFMGLSDGSELSESSVWAGGRSGDVGYMVGWHQRALASVFREDMVAAGFGLRVGAGWVDEVGLTVKYLSAIQSPTVYTPLNASLSLLGPSAVAFDLGLGWRVAEGVRVGFTAHDLNAPSFSMVGESVPLVRTFRAGVAWTATDGQFTVALDQVLRGTDYQARVGVEAGWADVKFRGGLMGGLPGAGTGFQIIGAAAGLGYAWPVEWGVVGFQYSGEWPFAVPGTSGTHRVSLDFSFVTPGSDSGAVEGSPPLRLPTVELFPVPWWLASSELTGSEECEEAVRRADAEPSRAVWAHRAALLSALERPAADAVKRYQRLMELDAKYELVGLQAIQALYASDGAATPSTDAALAPLTQAYRRAVADMSDPPADVRLGLAFLLARSHQAQEAADAYQQWRLKADVPDPGALMSWALALVEAGNPTAAIKVMGEVRGETSQQPWVNEVWGRVFLAANDRDRAVEAVRAFQEADRLSADRGRSQYHVAVAQYHAGWFTESLQTLHEAANRAPDDPLVQGRVAALKGRMVHVFVQRGDESFKQNQLRPALEWYQKALAIEPAHRDALDRIQKTQTLIQQQITIHRELAMNAVSRRDFEQALIEWQEVLRVDPDHPEAKEDFARWYEYLSRAAREDVEKEEWAFAHTKIKTLERVRPEDERVAALRDELKRAFERKSQSLEGQRKYPEAIAVWTDYLKLVPLDADGAAKRDRVAGLAATLAAEALSEAKAERAARRIAGAKRKADEGLAIRPDWEDALAFRRALQEDIDAVVRQSMSAARTALGAAKFGEARKALEAALAVQPDHPEAKAELAKLQKTEASRDAEWWRAAQKWELERLPEKALDALRELLAVKPAHEEGVKLRAVILQRMAKAKEQTAAVKQLILKGDLAYGNGDLKAALAAYEEAAELDYYDILNLSIHRKIDDVKKELK